MRFKRLIHNDHVTYVVNLEHIAFMQRRENMTSIYFSAADNERIKSISVIETPEEILGHAID